MAFYQGIKEGDKLPVIRKSVSQKHIQEYAEVSEDFNPIHVDKDFAVTTGFGGTIAHGMMILAFISEMMTDAFQKDWLSKGKLKIRFRAPVYPDENVATFGFVKNIKVHDGFKEAICSVGIRKQNGDDAINGEATVIF